MERQVKFGEFELDLGRYELRRGGQIRRLERIPLELLMLLVQRQGQLVTREEIASKLWGEGVFVDTAQGINTAIRKIRLALKDDPDQPRYVGTVVGKGYRFMASIENASISRAIEDTTPPSEATTKKEILLAPPRRVLTFVCLLAGAFGLALVLGLHVRKQRSQVQSKPSGTLFRSLAVLPLQNLSGDKDQEYFADGLTDELITDLGRTTALRVISRTSVMRYKQTDKTLSQIGRELGADAIVEGTVFRSRTRIRITAQLIDAQTDRHLWAQNFERDLHDVLGLQREVALAIASQVRSKLVPRAGTGLASVPSIDPQALNFYLQGSEVLNRGGDPQLSRRYFQEAIRKSPGFASAYVGIARTYDYVGNIDEYPAAKAFSKEKEFALKALELDDHLDSAHAAVAKSLLFGEWDWAGAKQEIKRALEVNPNSEDAHRIYSLYLSMQNRPEEAIAEARRTLEINPASAWPYFNLGMAYYFARRYDEAIAEFQKAKEQNSFAAPRFALSWAYGEKGAYKEALIISSSIPAQDLSMPAVGTHVGNLYARAGKTDEARKILAQFAEKAATEHTGDYGIALIYAGLGEKDHAFAWLDKAYADHDKGLCFLMVDPPLDPLRPDPRFQDLLRRMNFPP